MPEFELIDMTNKTPLPGARTAPAQFPARPRTISTGTASTAPAAQQNQESPGYAQQAWDVVKANPKTAAAIALGTAGYLAATRTETGRRLVEKAKAKLFRRGKEKHEDETKASPASPSKEQQAAVPALPAAPQSLGIVPRAMMHLDAATLGVGAGAAARLAYDHMWNQNNGVLNGEAKDPKALAAIALGAAGYYAATRTAGYLASKGKEKHETKAYVPDNEVGAHDVVKKPATPPGNGPKKSTSKKPPTTPGGRQTGNRESYQHETQVGRFDVLSP
eukprot:g14896.t1